MIFNHKPWTDITQIWWLILRSLRKWSLPYKDHMQRGMDRFILHISGRLQAPVAPSFSPTTPDLSSFMADALAGGCSSLCISGPVLGPKLSSWEKPPGILPSSTIRLKLHDLLARFAPLEEATSHVPVIDEAA